MIENHYKFFYHNVPCFYEALNHRSRTQGRDGLSAHDQKTVFRFIRPLAAQYAARSARYNMIHRYGVGL